MEKVDQILEKIDDITFEWMLERVISELVLTEDLDRIARDMWRRSKRAVMTHKDPEKMMKKVIKLTQSIATKAGYKPEDVVAWFYDELADEEIPKAKRKGKLWHEFFAKEYKRA